MFKRYIILAICLLAMIPRDVIWEGFEGQRLFYFTNIKAGYWTDYKVTEKFKFSDMEEGKFTLDMQDCHFDIALLSNREVSVIDLNLNRPII
jgi:hypothetical protein